MSDTETQSPADAVAALGLTVESVFVPFSQSRNKAGKHRSLNWIVTIKRNGRDVLTTDYSAGVAHCPCYQTQEFKGRYGRGLTRQMAQLVEYETETGRAAQRVNSCTILRGKPILPDPLDVIYSLVTDASVLDSSGFEDWASDFGYETDSRAAESIYRACLEIALKLRAGIGAAGLSQLRDAFQDY